MLYPTILLGETSGCMSKLVSSPPCRGPGGTLTSHEPKTLRFLSKARWFTPGLGTGMLEPQPAGRQQQQKELASCHHRTAPVVTEVGCVSPLVGGWLTGHLEHRGLEDKRRTQGSPAQKQEKDNSRTTGGQQHPDKS